MECCFAMVAAEAAVVAAAEAVAVAKIQKKSETRTGALGNTDGKFRQKGQNKVRFRGGKHGDVASFCYISLFLGFFNWFLVCEVPTSFTFQVKRESCNDKPKNGNFKGVSHVKKTTESLRSFPS